VETNYLNSYPTSPLLLSSNFALNSPLFVPHQSQPSKSANPAPPQRGLAAHIRHGSRRQVRSAATTAGRALEGGTFAANASKQVTAKISIPSGHESGAFLVPLVRSALCKRRRGNDSPYLLNYSVRKTKSIVQSGRSTFELMVPA
jgi:hypothetical protein